MYIISKIIKKTKRKNMIIFKINHLHVSSPIF